MDRLDHYRRDSYFNGVHFYTRANIQFLLNNITMYYYTKRGKPSSEKIQIRLSKQAIKYVFQLLDAKQYLIDLCFQSPENLAYDAMLHRAVNLFLGVYEQRGKEFESKSKLRKAFELLLLTDDELLTELVRADSSRVIRKIIMRIRNRQPYVCIGKLDIPPADYSIRDIREMIASKARREFADIILRPDKHFGSKKVPTKEWLNLHYLFDADGENLRDYKDNQKIDSFKQIQDNSSDDIWLFAEDENDKPLMKEAVRAAFPRNFKELY